jgi:hypothetical protein
MGQRQRELEKTSMLPLSSDSYGVYGALAWDIYV